MDERKKDGGVSKLTEVDSVPKVDVAFLRQRYQKHLKKTIITSPVSGKVVTRKRSEEDAPTQFVRVVGAKPAKCHKAGRKTKHKKKTESTVEEDIEQRVKKVSRTREETKEDHVIRAKRKARKKSKERVTVKEKTSEQLDKLEIESKNVKDSYLPDVNIEDETDDICTSTEQEPKYTEPFKLTTAEALIGSQFGKTVLEKMHEKQAFDKALNSTEEEELAKFFAGKTSFSNHIIELLDRGVEKSLQNFRNANQPSPAADIVQFLDNPIKAKTVLVDTLIINQNLLPQQWNGKSLAEDGAEKTEVKTSVPINSSVNSFDTTESQSSKSDISSKSSTVHKQPIPPKRDNDDDLISYSLVPQSVSSAKDVIKPTTSADVSNNYTEEDDLSYLPASYSMNKKM